MNSTLSSAGILGILLTVWLFHRLAIGRERDKAIRNACLKLRSAFSEAKATLSNGTVDAHAVMTKWSAQHDAAIVEFRHYVRRWKRKCFDATCEKYRQCRQEIKPGILRYYEAQATEKPIDSSSTQKLIEAINELLAFADKI